MALKWRRFLGWLTNAEEGMVDVTVSVAADIALTPRAQYKGEYIRPQYCENGCGRLQRECGSGGHRYSKCEDIFTPPPFDPDAKSRGGVSSGGHYHSGYEKDGFGMY